ncbi:MAG: hypothetical protein A2176_05145 [Spirochaetes bacterium RBG_13_51_14]|nr:MAG: hypothetical protein A2176_05145 [Spirochaetes bacterium RBG_13_51_14]
MEYINISHKRDYEFKIHTVSSEHHESYTVFNIMRDKGYWCSRKSDENMTEYIIIDLQSAVTIDYIEMAASPNGPKTFPRDFRFEGSLDGDCWMVMHAENKLELESDRYRLDIPLAIVRYLKILITAHQQSDEGFYSEIGRVRTGIAGVSTIRSSGASSADRGPDAVLKDDPETYWESEPKSHAAKESLLIDMGKLFHINRIILGSASKGFPESFYIEASADNNVWMPLLEEKNFKAQANKKYYWKTDITPAQYVRIEAKGVKYPEGKYGVQISHVEISAAPFNPFHTHNIGDLTPYASIFQAGIVRLSKDGDDSPGTAIQGNDRRLRDASAIFKGIVQMADDGDATKGLAIQASDSRLKQATDLKPGIVRLAHDRETKAGSAVQGSDSRLRDATTENFGIVKLCPDGMYKENAAVTGNDSRLHKAAVESYGICRLAPEGGTASGTAVQANDKRLREATTTFKGIVELAEDGEDVAGVAVQGNDRRLRDATTTAKGIVELAEDGEDAAGVAVQGNDRRLKIATEHSKGIVELAENGEANPGVVVQGSDRRLRDATTTAKGIVGLAEDGENKAGVAVQGSDKRLKDATTTAKGIVELAEDGENKAGVAVQGSDKRLRDATTTTKGIVELAEDGKNKAGVAVQGSDKRLRDATTAAKGIVKLAKDGEDKPGVAVQGSDKRLKNATASSKGIVRLAEDGETNSGVAVQGSDKRLRDATTISKGIVELAEDGEDAPGAAVQGNDKRLKPATESAPGIVELVKNNESKPGRVVQSTDERLSNARPPLPHTHEYAPISHEFSSHTGTISVRNTKHEVFPEITPPSDGSAIIYAKNESVESGSIGISGIAGISAEKNIHSYGMVGHGGHVGVRGQSSGDPDGENRGCGVMGLSRFGAGGVFSSEHNFSLVADGFGTIGQYDDSVHLAGSGDALFVNGASVFQGTMHIHNTGTGETENFPANMVELFEVDDAEYIAPGDLLVASDTGKSILSRSRNEYSRAVIGIVSGNPTIIINNSGKEKKVYPVALAGTALCKIDARKNPVRPGDPVVTSDTPGCGMAGAVDSFDKIGTVIGKALDALEDGIGFIPVFITHQ